MVYSCEANLESIENTLKVIDQIANDMVFMPLEDDGITQGSGAIKALTAIAQWYIDDLRKDDHLL